MQERIKSPLSPIHITISIIIILLSLYPLINNYKYNNHSKNWLNHDYGKNLLSSTEQYSVFMTEGGDNQVFSSLYFTYAEKLRQDVFPYDQKGNIFKRIYGDLRYVTYETLQTRSHIVNQGLFTGEEPFYTEIRSLKPPYLVPYPLGKPATYLTWKLPNPQTLGDFYYKLYGQMYKVQDISYAIIDHLEITGTASIDEITASLEETLGRTIEDQELNLWIAQLVRNKYITSRGTTLTFLKSYPKPFVKDPSLSFVKRWDEIDNLPYYDYLSREIVISFAYEQVTFLSESIQNQQRIYQNEDSKTIKNEIIQDIEKKWNQIEEYIALIKKVGPDSSATLHNLGIFYLTAKETFYLVEEDLIDQSIELWQMVVANTPYAWSTYNVLLWSYVREAIRNPQKSEAYFVEFDTALDQMTNNMTHFISMKKDITKAKPYQSIEQLVYLRENFNQVSGPAFLTQEKNVREMLNNNTPVNALDLAEIQAYFSKVINQLSFLGDTPQEQEFFKLWLRLWQRVKSNPDFFAWHVNLLGELANYGDLIDPVLFEITAQEASSYMPKNPKTQEDLTIFISMYKIAQITEDAIVIKQYEDLLLTMAQRVLPLEQFNAFQQQVIDNSPVI